MAWRAGTSNRIVVAVRQAGNRFLGSVRARYEKGKPADCYVESSATITQGRLCYLGDRGTAAAAGQQHAQAAGSDKQNRQRAAQGAHQGAQEDERERAKEAGQGEEGEREDGSEHEQDQLYKFRQIKKDKNWTKPQL